jgi:hypothetical protein
MPVQTNPFQNPFHTQEMSYRRCLSCSREADVRGFAERAKRRHWRLGSSGHQRCKRLLAWKSEPRTSRQLVKRMKIRSYENWKVLTVSYEPCSGDRRPRWPSARRITPLKVDIKILPRFPEKWIGSQTKQPRLREHCAVAICPQHQRHVRARYLRHPRI